MEWHAKQENIHVAHIYPYSMNTVPRDASFWFTLQVFWSMEKIDEWKKALFTERMTEVCKSLITMARQSMLLDVCMIAPAEPWRFPYQT
jgi:hypothetical protein